MERFLGVDLAWRDSDGDRVANESGVAVLDDRGRIIDAGWTRGLDATVTWIERAAADRPALLFVDAPLVVTNARGQRICETQVGQRYGRWKVSANTTNAASPRLAGVALRERLETRGWAYSDGHHGPPRAGQMVSECYPYTTLVGTTEFGYDQERPRYKRKPKALPVSAWRPRRAETCDELISRLHGLATVVPPLLLDSHPVARQLTEEPSPDTDLAYKHREDLIDALICAWTATLWARHGTARCQVLGPAASPHGHPPVATIIAPARPEQRR
ncbi:DUF429 domain-containing protein [Actinomadura sp. 9N407]|uniref:DUF429 domain-containing protein n=1 Tax=Actinomadura sp. 9N407 TaxID=3375154 RepID=UPI0037A77902